LLYYSLESSVVGTFFYNCQKNVTFVHRYQVAKYVIFDSEKIFVKKFPWMLKYNYFKQATHTRFKGPRVPKKAQFTHERVEYNVFLFDEPLKGSKSLKTFIITLTFRFEKF
jgi:hypothetical protein